MVFEQNSILSLGDKTAFVLTITHIKTRPNCTMNLMNLFIQERYKSVTNISLYLKSMRHFKRALSKDKSQNNTQQTRNKIMNDPQKSRNAKCSYKPLTEETVLFPCSTQVLCPTLQVS